MADQTLLATAAALSNVYLGTSLSENPRDYMIAYRALGATPAERKEAAQAVQAEVDMGLASRVDALRRLHPEIESDEEAIDRLLRVQEIEQILRDAMRPKAEKQDTSEG
ncbi:MAG TPA: hypothetical protein EYN66_18120 [Myxococcales bacterium]|nr:hypothetical protein [Myxococcales bacterium]